MVVDDARQPAFEASQCFGGRHAFGLLLLVVGLAQSVHPDLGDRDPVDRCVELPVARSSQSDSSGGVARPHRDRRDAGVAGKGCFGFEAADPGGLPDELGRSQLPDPGHRQQHRNSRTSLPPDTFREFVDLAGQLDDLDQFIASDLRDNALDTGQSGRQPLLVLGQVQ